MWIKDKYSHPINMDAVVGIFVDTNPDGGYEVKANNPSNELVAQFVTGTPPMSEVDATTLMNRMADMLGVVDLND